MVHLERHARKSEKGDSPTMPWIRGIIFTVLVPGTIALYIPFRMAERLSPPGGFWDAGWLVSVVGAMGYVLCFLHFLASGGTPAIFFTRPVRFLIGEEPGRLVQGGLYRVTRNPMYVSVLLVIFGQALRFSSWPIAEYGLLVWLHFHIVVVLLEEPHLREQRGPSYEEYCRQVPRWIGLGIPKTTSAMLLSVLVLTALSAATDISGKWEIEARFDDPNIEAGGFDCVVKQQGERLTGKCSDGTASLDGEIDGQMITWRVSNSEQPPVTTTFIGTLNRSGTTIEGKFSSGTRVGRFAAAKS
jgi:protein-S-isoprenylcysteine O-methyltransferase Ste14